MKLTGDPAKSNVLEVDSRVYLLIRKASTCLVQAGCLSGL